MRILEAHCGLYDSKMNPIKDKDQPKAKRRSKFIDDEIQDTLDNLATFSRENLTWWLRNEKSDYIAEVLETLLTEAGR